MWGIQADIRRVAWLVELKGCKPGRPQNPGEVPMSDGVRKKTEKQ